MKRYEKLYQEIEKLKPEDTLQLVIEAETEKKENFIKEDEIDKNKRSLYTKPCKQRNEKTRH